jgi:hypothetical protein
MRITPIGLIYHDFNLLTDIGATGSANFFSLANRKTLRNALNLVQSELLLLVVNIFLIVAL